VLRCDRLEARDTPAIWAASGNLVYELTARGEFVRAVQPFPDAPAVPVHLATGPGVLYVGAGEGGGPRLSAIGMAGFAEEWSVWVGDPASRHGVDVAVFDSPIRATPDPTLPPTALQLRREQSAVDRYDPAYLPPDLVVTVFGGHSITQLPEWEYLKGVPSGNHPGHSSDEAVGVAVPGHVWAAADFGAVPHELGHAVHFARGLDLTPQQQEAFADAFAETGAPPIDV
jgi:hypothetical protein